MFCRKIPYISRYIAYVPYGVGAQKKSGTLYS